MRTLTLSVAGGERHYEKHNVDENYRAELENVDEGRISQNVVIINISERQAYDIIFSKSLEEYNADPRRKYRQIKSYYNHVRDSKQEKVSYETVFMIGDSKTFPANENENVELANKVFRDFHERFLEKYPSMIVFSSVIHNDEKTPHLHLAYVPVSHGNKRGLETRNSLRKAVRECGFRDLKAWNHDVWDLFEDVCYEHGIRREVVGIKRTDLSTNHYRELMDAYGEEIDEIKRVKQELIAEIDETEAALSDIREHGLSRVEEKIDGKKNEIENLNDVIYEKEEELAQLKWGISNPYGYGAREILAELNEKIKSLEADISTLKVTKKQLEEKVDELNARLTEVGKREEEVAKKDKQVEARLENVQNRERNLDEEVAQKASEALKPLQASLKNQYDDAVDGLAQEAAIMDDERSMLSRGINHVAEMVKEIPTIIDDLKKAREKYNTALENWRDGHPIERWAERTEIKTAKGRTTVLDLFLSWSSNKKESIGSMADQATRRADRFTSHIDELKEWDREWEMRGDSRSQPSLPSHDDR